jgi:alkylhydroperoxidase family enzyme
VTATGHAWPAERFEATAYSERISELVPKSRKIERRQPMRLKPIEKPKGLPMRIAFWMTRRQLGKVLTPMKVLYPRMPGVLKLSFEIQKFETKGIHLERGLHFMVATLVSAVNGCGFCVDISRAMAIREHLRMEKFNALSEYPTSPFFSDRERAALAYVEEATRHKRVSDATFTALRKHFSEREIVEITWLNAVHNYYNLINLPLEIESDGLCAIAQTRTA